MPKRSDNTVVGRGERRTRRRLRGAFSGKAGRAVGITSIAAPLVGVIVNDLKKPDGFIRTLIGRTAKKLIEGKSKKTKAIDITDKVEVIVDDSDKNQ